MKYEVCVTRNFEVNDFAYITVEADNAEEAKEFAMGEAQSYPHLFDIDNEPDIKYEIESVRKEPK